MVQGEGFQKEKGKNQPIGSNPTPTRIGGGVGLLLLGRPTPLGGLGAPAPLLLLSSYIYIGG